MSSGQESASGAFCQARTDREGAQANAPAPWRGRAIHFIGVGGAGMSGYARAAHALGASVSGSDRAASAYSERLRTDGIVDPSIGHDPRNLPDGANLEVVYSSAVGADNPERVRARARGLPELSRAQLLGELSALKRTIAVAGTHGKSTTASMLVWALRQAGADPGWLVGAPVGQGLANAHWSAGEWLVIEADESDRSMLSLVVQIALLTNVELDHADAYGSLSELRGAFRQFLASAPTAVVCDRPDLVDLCAREPITFSVHEPILSATSTRFRWRSHEVCLPVLGLHNALDAACALEGARLTGAAEDACVRALAGFHGAGRRFEHLGQSASRAAIYDDYAHHPTEVRATLQAARLRTAAGGRLVAVFQPHLYSRTRSLARQLGQALALADTIVVLDIYGAREQAADFPGVSGLLVARAAAQAAHGRPVYWLADFAQARPVLAELLAPEDVCVCMGAGDIDVLARSLLVRGAPSPEGRP